jgi:hypothetical protein
VTGSATATRPRSQAEALAAFTSDADLLAAKQRLGEALPASGWLHDYLTAVTPLTDAPVEFHLASGLCAISAAIGNQVYVESWGQSIFPHLWAVLVAPSSFWRKSTSINTAEALLRSASETSLLPSDFSREKFLRILAERPAGLLTVKEFGGFLATLGRDYMGGMKENLTELYDGPDVFTRALQSGEIKIQRPAVTILAATTLDWLESRITDGDLRGGFLARFLFVTASQKATTKGLTRGMDPVQRVRLTSDLADIAHRPPAKAEYAPGVEELLNDWMSGWEAEVGRTRHRSDLSGFAVRLQTYALKLAMIYRASTVAGDEGHSSAVIDELSARQAIAYCRVLWTNVAGLIDDEIATTKEAKELRRLTTIIGSGATRSDALKLSKMRARDFDDYLKALIDSHQITSEKRRSSEVGIERQRDSSVQWLAPVDQRARHLLDTAAAVHPDDPDEALGVPVVPRSYSSPNGTGIPSEPQGTVRSGEPEELQGVDLSSDSPSSSLSFSLSSNDLTNQHIHARPREGTASRNSKPDQPFEVDELDPRDLL